MTRSELDSSNNTNILGVGLVDKTRHSTHNNNIANYIDQKANTLFGTTSEIRAYDDDTELIAIVTTDYGGGLWYVDESDSSSLDNTGTILVTSSGVRVKRIFKGDLNAGWFGLNGNGIVDNTNAIQAAIDTANDLGIGMFVPPGTYLVTGLSTNGVKNIYGAGKRSILKTVSNQPIIVVTTDGVEISKLLIQGSGKGAGLSNQIGVECDAVYRTKITDVEFRDLAESGYSIANTHTLSDPSGQIVNCEFYDNKIGFLSKEQGEYVQVSSCSFSGNTTAIDISGGNIAVNGCNVIGNSNGFHIRDGVNSGHGIATGCQINHNGNLLGGHNIFVEGTDNGFTFVGCHIMSADDGGWGMVYLKNCVGVIFKGCSFLSMHIYMEGINACSIAECFYLINTPVFHPNFNGSPSYMHFSNNIHSDGSMGGLLENINGTYLEGILASTPPVTNGSGVTLKWDITNIYSANNNNFTVGTVYEIATGLFVNLGLGGNTIKINAAFNVEYSSDIVNILPAIYVDGVLLCYMNKYAISSTLLHCQIDAEIKIEQGQKIGFFLGNFTSAPVSFGGTGSYVKIEGL